MKYVGPHVSIAGGVENAVGRALDTGANAFGMFTRNQRQWDSPPLEDKSAEAFRSALAESGIKPRHVVPHSSYLVNLASPDRETREKSLTALTDEVRRAERLGLTMVNFHPGSHKGELSDRDGLMRIADGMNDVLSRTSQVALVAEGTAGSGNNLGAAFEDLASLVEATDDRTRVGVCLDTCHLYAAGFDIRSPAGWNATLRSLDATVGLPFLRALHLNDSKVPLGSRKDRHASLGFGKLGLEVFRTILRDYRLHDVPMILETTQPRRWPAEVRMLRAFADPRRIRRRTAMTGYRRAAPARRR